VIPFVHVPEAFHWLVLFAVVSGTYVGYRRSARLGLDQSLVLDMAVVAVVAGFIGAHLFSLIVYFPERIAEDPWVLLDITSGISSIGGFLGGTLGVILLFRVRGVRLWPYTDPMVYGLTFAWIFGRLGCTLAHDHPGSPTTFALAVNYPAFGGFPPGPRHDLGLYELVFTLVLFGLFYARRNRPRFPGWHVVAILIGYMPVRFAFDFLRTADVLYLGLTGAQILCVPLFALGLVIWRQQKRSGQVISTNSGSADEGATGATEPPAGESPTKKSPEPDDHPAGA